MFPPRVSDYLRGGGESARAVPDARPEAVQDLTAAEAQVRPSHAMDMP